MRRTGYLILADLSGYTAYLTSGELEHAQDILGKLFDALLDELEPPVRFSNFQGDAILCHLPDGHVQRGQSLLETLESLYGRFADARDRVQRNTACDCCRACNTVDKLDLKMILHHGEYVEHSVGGRRELGGPDVILTHRLLKNSVREETGVAAYLLITSQATQALDFGAALEPMRTHREEYEHLGAVELRVHDLAGAHASAADRHRRARRETAPSATWDTFERHLPLTPLVAWELLTAPERRALWEEGGAVRLSGGAGGRVGVGTTGRCARGRPMDDFAIVDWQPFDYYAEEHAMPLLGGTARYQVSLAATANGCAVEWRILDGERGRINGFLRRFLLRPLLRRRTARCLSRLDALAAREGLRATEA